MDYISTTPLYDSNYLAHYGIKQQKWGYRRFQNEDGTLTEAGRARYGSMKAMKKAARKEYRKDNATAKKYGDSAAIAASAAARQSKTLERAQKRYNKNPTDKNKLRLDAETKANEFLKNAKKVSQETAEKHYNELSKKIWL